MELLEERLHNGARALDVGSGSGYLTACMAKLLGPKGLVIGIEHIPELREFATENIQRDNPELLRDGCIELVGNCVLNNLQILYLSSFFFSMREHNVSVGDGRLGYPEKAPYDAIHVGAAAKEMPQAVREHSNCLISSTYHKRFCSIYFCLYS